MKPQDFELTIEELDKLCMLYMECKLSVLEEKELEYILTRTAMTSPAIGEVRALMNIPVSRQAAPAPEAPRKRFAAWRYISGLAASIAVIIAVALYFTLPQSSGFSSDDSAAFVTAYARGERLSDKEAVLATNIAMAKADSLMNYAALMQREQAIKANEIISITLNN